jgi:hypothetical protein
LNDTESRGIGLRLAGSVAIAMRSNTRYRRRGRDAWVPADLDFVCREHDVVALTAFFSERGYTYDKRILIATEGARWIFAHPGRMQSLDLFVDRMVFCHELDLRERVTIDRETLTVADLLLSKLQYVAPRGADLDDMNCLLHDHELACEDGPSLNQERVCDVLGRDWGFYHTASLNFDRMRSRLLEPGFSGDRSAVHKRLEDLRRAVELCPKSVAWKVRAAVGTRVSWYNEVEDTDPF